MITDTIEIGAQALEVEQLTAQQAHQETKAMKKPAKNAPAPTKRTEIAALMKRGA